MSLSDDYVASGGGTTLTVALSRARDVPTTIAINRPSGLTIPSIVVPAGQTSASVTVASASSVSPTIFSLVASLDAWKQKSYLVVSPTTSIFAINYPSVRTGQGVALVSWASQREELFGATIRGFEVWKKVGTTETKLSLAPSGENRFLDAHCTQTGTQYKVKLVTRTGKVLSESSWLAAAPSTASPSVTLTSTPSSPVTDKIVFGVNASTLQGGLGTLYVDGLSAGRFDPARGPNLANPSVDARKLAGGAHECVVVGEIGKALIVSAPFSVTVSPRFDAVKYEDVVDGSLGEVAQFGFDAPDATTAMLRAQIVASDGTVVRTFQTSGDKLNFGWDGKDANGSTAPNGQYMLRLAIFSSDDPNSTAPYTFEDYICNVFGWPTYLSLATIFPDSAPQDQAEVNKIVQVFSERGQANGVGALVLKANADATMSKRLRLKIRQWMLTSVTCLHVSAHGNRYPSDDGRRVWTAITWGGMRFHPTYELQDDGQTLIDDRSPEDEFCVGAFPLGHRYEFVYLDTCYSGTQGPYDLNDYTGHLGAPSSIWAQAFHLNDLDQTFIGWTGKIGQNRGRLNYGLPESTGMLIYRLSFWDALAAHRTANQAYNAAIGASRNYMTNEACLPDTIELVNGQYIRRWFCPTLDQGDALP